jgi:hypothetical protein
MRSGKTLLLLQMKKRGLMNEEITGLSVSSNGRFLQNAGGDPFFLLADTAWELFHRLRFEEIEFYLDSRKKQGFNVIQTVLISELDGLRIPNAYGLVPLKDMDPGKPDPEYFDFIDKVLKLAESKEMYLTLVPVWGDKIDRIFGIGPEIFNEKNAFSYGRWLGRRYRTYPNIIWMNGGDRTGGGKNFEIWNALGKGIKSEDSDHLMTFHPLGDASSSMWFHNSEWLDFNSCQSGHSMRNFPNHMMITYDYLRNPPKPCIDSEPRYEEHAVNWKPLENGVFDDYDIRQAAYWSVFAGACGHTYGTHPVWQMFDNHREPIGFVRFTWKEALGLKGGGQLVHLKNLILSRPFFCRVPYQSLLIAPKVGDEHIRCTRGDSYAFFYLPSGGGIEIKANVLNWRQSTGWWFDPRCGESFQLGQFKNTDNMTFAAPGQGRGNDWVLVLDDSVCNYIRPGF